MDEDFVDYAQLLLSSKPTDRRTDLERTSIVTTTLLDIVSTAFTNNCYNFLLFKIENVEKIKNIEKKIKNKYKYEI